MVGNGHDCSAFPHNLCHGGRNGLDRSLYFCILLCDVTIVSQVHHGLVFGEALLIVTTCRHGEGCFVMHLLLLRPCDV